jgi:RNA polymerase sigma-54 factor
MQKLGLNHSLGQKLSPQQIQFIKLLQIPTAELESRIEEEMEVNPALEEGKDEPEENSSSEEDSNSNDEESNNEESNNNEEESIKEDKEDDINVEDYIRDDDISGYKMQGDGPSDEDDREMPMSSSVSLNELLLTQLGFLRLDERQNIIGKQLIGSIDNDGYIRRDLDQIVNDLAFAQNIDTTAKEVEGILFKVQSLDPPGIAARNLQECLSLQLDRKDDQDEVLLLASKIIDDCFEEFTKKHYDKIKARLNITDEEIKKAVALITKLNPKPGEVSSGEDSKTLYVIPDFILVNNNGKLELSLNSRNAPELRISRSYTEMLQTYGKSTKKDKKLKEAVSFVKQKLDSAKWFIDAIRQRQQTLLRTMESIIKYQYDFFLEGDEAKLRPMILKDIATEIQMDISTVSRVANSKSVQTEFGTYPLKYFFSEGIATDSGEDVSSREVKHILKEVIGNEDKNKPLSDEKLEKILKNKGYNIARRTVAKYREQLNIPVARLRKEL